MLLLADSAGGKIRSPFTDRRIDVDAIPYVENGRIRMLLTIASHRLGGGPPSENVEWNHTLTVILDSGKPLVVFEAADPSNGAKTAIELKATILK